MLCRLNTLACSGITRAHHTPSQRTAPPPPGQHILQSQYSHSVVPLLPQNETANRPTTMYRAPGSLPGRREVTDCTAEATTSAWPWAETGGGQNPNTKRLRALAVRRAVRLRLPLALGGRDGSCRKCNVRSKRDLDSPVRDSGANSERTACRRAPCDGPCPIDGHGGRGHNSQDTTVNTYRLRVLAVLCGVRFRRARHNHISTVQLDNSRVRPRWSIGI